MKKIIFLKSSATDKPSYREFLKVLPKKPREMSICSITTAADPEPDKGYLLEGNKVLRSLGFNKIVNYDLKNKNEEKLRKDLADFDIIFVRGGNTFYLLKYIRQSGFDKVLPQLLDRGKIYIGSSAGSYVTCPTIEVSKWKRQDKNVVRLRGLKGMNFVPFLIFAHYEEKYRGLVKGESKKVKIPVVVLSDKQAILCIDGTYKIVGKGKKLVFNDSDSLL